MLKRSKILLAAAGLSMAALLPTVASAAEVVIGVGGYPAPAPVYYAPAPVVYGGPYYYGYHHWYHGYYGYHGYGWHGGYHHGWR
jgi:hypothetical protein